MFRQIYDKRKMRNWINTRLKELGKTKAGLARHLGVPFSRVSEMINGKRRIQPAEIKPFADFMEIRADEVLVAFSTDKALAWEGTLKPGDNDTRKFLGSGDGPPTKSSARLQPERVPEDVLGAIIVEATKAVDARFAQFNIFNPKAELRIEAIEHEIGRMVDIWRNRADQPG